MGWWTYTHRNGLIEQRHNIYMGSNDDLSQIVSRVMHEVHVATAKRESYIQFIHNDWPVMISYTQKYQHLNIDL